MAFLYITEYAQMQIGPAGRVGQVPLESPIAEHTVTIAAGSNQSAAFNAATRMVRLHCDAICSISFGANPTAAATNARMAANQTECHGVPFKTGNPLKVAVISNV
jgi:hypothetical protein